MELKKNQLTILKTSRPGMAADLDAFLLDGEARALSPCTLRFYTNEVGAFCDFLPGRSTGDVTPTDVRRFLTQLATHRGPGGVHAAFRAVRAFLRWYWREHDLEKGCPVNKVRPPRLPQEPLDPVPLTVVQALLCTCERKTFAGDRDKAALLCLLDSGCRAAELLALNMGDANMKTGTLIVRRGKGGKSRVTFMSPKARQELARYLRHRGPQADDAPLWVTRGGKRLTYAGLRQMVRRRASQAGVKAPALHAFRRAFVVLSLRAGADLLTLQALLGHSDLSVLRRYAKQTEGDLRRVHAGSSPVSNFI